MVEYLCGGRVTNYKDRSRSFEVRGGRSSDQARGVTVHGSSTCSLTCRSTRWIDKARGVSADATEACGQPCMSMCGALHEFQSCSLTTGRSGGVLAMLKDMWSTSEGSVQLKVNQVKISSDGKQVNMAIEGERNKVIDLECSRFSPRGPVHGFRSVEVRLDTSPGSRRTVQKLMEVPVIFKDSVMAGGRTIWADLLVVILVLQVLCHIGRTTSTSGMFWGGLVFPRPRIQRVLTLSLKSGLGTGLGLVALGKDDRIAWCWTLGPPV
ncbi:hypothetical protein F2Q69_00027751 [Brassica cretica]|uniref:Uncharacterized protein n=1 Tax=Brassica cretica TaxID=69181 RepID=A0A8S9RVI9_BRACR|nr:hypothetical protein F2Q69_00027751 [Brassica cretica]